MSVHKTNKQTNRMCEHVNFITGPTIIELYPFAWYQFIDFRQFSLFQAQIFSLKFQQFFLYLIYINNEITLGPGSTQTIYIMIVRQKIVEL